MVFLFLLALVGGYLFSFYFHDKIVSGLSYVWNKVKDFYNRVFHKA